jgi:hypothetical protein
MPRSGCKTKLKLHLLCGLILISNSIVANPDKPEQLIAHFVTCRMGCSDAQNTILSSLIKYFKQTIIPFTHRTILYLWTIVHPYKSFSYILQDLNLHYEMEKNRFGWFHLIIKISLRFENVGGSRSWCSDRLVTRPGWKPAPQSQRHERTANPVHTAPA